VSDDNMSVGELISGAIARSYSRLAANEAGVHDGHDPEAVHQARVATRRLRSDLRTFEKYVDEQWARNLRAELHWLGADLGAVRDIEVMRDRLRLHAATLPVTDTDAAEHVIRRLDADREVARATLVASLKSQRYANLRAALAAAATTPKLRKRAKRPADTALTKVVHKRWKKLDKAVGRLGESPPDEALHDVRMRAKRVRYAAEACAPAVGKPARRFAHAMTAVQDLLGEQHDAVVASAWLEKTADECTPGEAYVLGQLACMEREVSRHAREAFPELWWRVSRKKLRSWM
jgi:CHAD domain-containing protein